MRSEESENNKSAKKDKELSENIFIEASNDRELEKLISELDFNSRLAIVLKDIEDYTEAETLDIVGVSKEILYGLITVAHESLIKSLEIQGGEEVLIHRLSQISKKILPGIYLWPEIINQLRGSEAGSEADEQSVVKNFGDFKSGLLKETKKKNPVKKNKKEIGSGKRLGLFINFNKIALYTILIFALIFTAYYFLVLKKTTWEVIKIKGTPKIDLSSVKNKESFGVGGILDVNSESEAQIDIDGYGRILVLPSTTIEKLPGINIARVQAGMISAFREKSGSRLTLELPYGQILDSCLSGSFDVEINSAGAAAITVNKGFIWVSYKDRKYVIPANYVCDGIKDDLLGIPYYITTSNTMRVNLSYFNTSDDKATTFATILSSSSWQDAASLWNLFGMVGRDERFKLYDKLASFVSPPKDVEKSGIIQLNKKMLSSWLNKIIALLM